MRLDYSFFLNLQTDARNKYLEYPQPSRLPGMTNDLVSGDLVGIAHFTVVVNALYKNKFLTEEQVRQLEVELCSSESDPAAEY